MGVFGNVEGIFNTLIRTLSDILGQADGGILVGAHIDDVVVALILHGAAGVESLDGLIGLDKVLAGAGFVAQTPDADGGVVDGGVHHLHIARHVLIAKFGNVAQRSIAIIVLMALNVGFIFKIDTVFVGQIVPIGVVAIVAVADVIDVGALHEHHFLLHLFTRDGMPAFGVGFVAVHPFHLDGASIEVIVATGFAEFIGSGGGVFDFNFAEADDGGEGFEHISLLVLQFTHQHIAVGGFGTPRLHAVAGVEGELHVLFGAAFHGNGGRGTHNAGGSGGFAVKFLLEKAVAEGEVFQILLGEVGDRGSDAQGGVHKAVVVVGNGNEVAHLHFGLCRERNRAEDTGKAEHILTLKKRPIAVTIHFNRHNVFALDEVGRDVEGGEVAGVFRKTDIPAVDIEIEERIDAIEIEVDFALFPVFRHGESATITAHFVAMLIGGPVFARLTHHAALPVAHGYAVLEDDALVAVDGRSIFQRTILLHTNDVPVHRHIDLLPL